MYKFNISTQSISPSLYLLRTLIFSAKLQYVPYIKISEYIPLSAGDKLIVAHGIVLFKGSWKTCIANCPFTNTHNSSPPAKAMFSWPEKLNDVRMAEVNLQRVSSKTFYCINFSELPGFLLLWKHDIFTCEDKFDIFTCEDNSDVLCANQVHKV